MKKVAVALVAIVGLWAVVMLTIRGASRTGAAGEWPMGLGKLESAPSRYRPQAGNESARQITQLSKTKDVAALRTQLLAAPPVWTTEPGRDTFPDLRAATAAGRLLTQHAKATGNWDDLRAEWELAKALWERPEFVSTLFALSMTRSIVDTIPVMPAPAPAWIDELRTYEYRRAALAAMQMDTWRSSVLVNEYIHSRGVTAPYWRLARADFLRSQREKAWSVARGQKPTATPAWWNRRAHVFTPNIDESWQRLAQLEADVKKLP